MPSVPAPLRIAIVNDYEIVVAGVAEMLAPYRDRLEVVELDCLTPVLQDVDIVLFDAFAHVADRGFRLPSTVHPDSPKVVLFTWSSDPRSIRTALDQGAAGYLSKGLPPIDLVKAIEDIHAGERIVSTVEVPENVHSTGDWPGREFDLSPREAEVLALVAQGLTNEDIAKALYLSINSVKTYIRTAYRKINVQRRSQAVAWALRHGFTGEPQRTFASRS
jgi:DNA-binding NarL/FixJ family response regulator